MVQFGAGAVLLEENISLDPPRQHLGELVLCVAAIRNTEDVVELLERLLLRLGNKEEDEGQSNQVKAGIEAKGSSGGHGGQHSRECKRQNGSPEVVGGDGP